MTTKTSVLHLQDGIPVQTQAVPPTTTAASIRMERKHPLAIRWMHWVNFPILFTMIWSGLLIYWNDSDNAYQHPHRVYRVGVGKLTLFRFFPDRFYKLLHVPYHVTTGLSYHFFFMWVFAVGTTSVLSSVKNGVVTLTGNVRSDDEKARISESLANIDGVKTVVNNLTISRAVQAAPAKAAMLVPGALSRFGRMERNVLAGVTVALPRVHTPDLLCSPVPR